MGFAEDEFFANNYGIVDHNAKRLKTAEQRVVDLERALRKIESYDCHECNAWKLIARVLGGKR